MKLFRECFGGTATVNPAAVEERGSRRQPEGHEGDTNDKITSYNNNNNNNNNNNKSRLKVNKVKPSSTITHWQPKLHAICEDGPMPEKAIGRQVETDDRKRPVKVKAKSPAKAVRARRQPSRPDDDYWNYSNVIAMPAFSPTPFMF